MKGLFILCVMAMTTAAQAQTKTAAESTAEKHYELLKNVDTNGSAAKLGYSFGLVYGYYVQGKNELRTEMAQTLLTAQEQLKLKSVPNLENAVFALNQIEGGMSDSTFCLLKGIATGNYFAGKEKADLAMAATADHERFQRVCQ
jgi:hypothetical protein